MTIRFDEKIPKKREITLVQLAGFFVIAHLDRAIQRGHGACEPRVVIMNPSAQHRREQYREPLRAKEAARA